MSFSIGADVWKIVAKSHRLGDELKDNELGRACHDVEDNIGFVLPGAKCECLRGTSFNGFGAGLTLHVLACRRCRQAYRFDATAPRNGALASRVSKRRFLPPDHLPVRRSADDRAPALNTVRRFNGYEFDTSGMDGEAVMERRLIKVAMYWAEIGEIGPATGQRIEAATC